MVGLSEIYRNPDRYRQPSRQDPAIKERIEAANTFQKKQLVRVPFGSDFRHARVVSIDLRTGNVGVRFRESHDVVFFSATVLSPAQA